MDAEIETYARELRWVLEQICVSLTNLSAAQLNWRPSALAPNSGYAIASHVVGSTRVYALGFGCGMLVERGRPAEFAGQGADAREIVARVRQLASEIEVAPRGA